jgi:hypothetical protein
MRLQVRSERPWLNPMRFGIRIHHDCRCDLVKVPASEKEIIPIVMDYGHHLTLGTRDSDPFGLETYPTLSRRAKATTFFDDQWLQVFDGWLLFIAYRGRCEFRIKCEAAFEDIDGCLWAGFRKPGNIALVSPVRRLLGVPIICPPCSTDYHLRRSKYYCDPNWTGKEMSHRAASSGDNIGF